MNKHTPGPWKICTNPQNPFWKDGVTIGAASPEDSRRVCDVWKWDGSPNEGMTAANARLIAAAPELLESLVQMLAKVRRADPNGYFDDMVILNAQHAIAKAKGETK